MFLLRFESFVSLVRLKTRLKGFMNVPAAPCIIVFDLDDVGNCGFCFVLDHVVDCILGNNVASEFGAHMFFSIVQIIIRACPGQGNAQLQLLLNEVVASHQCVFA